MEGTLEHSKSLVAKVIDKVDMLSVEEAGQYMECINNQR
jgi:hypothetical protein